MQEIRRMMAEQNLNKVEFAKRLTGKVARASVYAYLADATIPPVTAVEDMLTALGVWQITWSVDPHEHDKAVRRAAALKSWEQRRKQRGASGSKAR